MSDWTPDCLSPEAMLQLATTGAEHAGAAEAAEHVLRCSYCLRVYAETRAACGAAPDRQAVAQPAPAVSRPAARRARSSALALAVGAAASAAALYVAAVLPARLEEARLRAALSAEKAAASRLAAESARLVAEARRQALAGATMPTADPGDAAALEAAVLRQRLDIPSAVLALSPVVRGTTSEPEPVIRLRRPVGTVVLDDRPELEAVPSSGAREVRLSLTDDAGMEVPAERVAASVWRPRRALRRGGVYDWSVQGRLGGQAIVSPVARFQVADARTGGTVSAARRRYRDHPLLLAVLYTRAGLLDDADAALVQVVAAHPGDGLARALLANLRRSRARAR